MQVAAVQRVLKGETFWNQGIEVGGVKLLLRAVPLPVLSVSHSSSPHLRNVPPQDGARLSASIKTRKAGVAEVAAEIFALNPGAANRNGDELTVERLMRGVEVDPEDASHVLRALWWNSKAIGVLPEGIGDRSLRR